MRIAIVIVGEPRYHAVTTAEIRDKIVRPLQRQDHAVDVILSMWNCRLPPGRQEGSRQNHQLQADASMRVRKPEEQTLIARILQPKMAAFLEKPAFSAAPYVPHTRSGTFTWGMMCQHHGWNFAAQQLQLCEDLYGYQYDTIMRLRLDAHFHHDIELPSPLDAIYVPMIEGHMKKPFNPGEMCNDQIAVGPRTQMLQALRILQHYPDFVQAKFAISPETVVHYHLVHILKCGFKTFPLRYHLQR